MLDLITLTNCLTDVTVNAEENDLDMLKIQRGMSNAPSRIKLKEFYEFIKSKEKKYFQAGSPGNVAFNSVKQEIKTGMLGSVAKDDFGESYIKAVKLAGISSFVKVCKGRSGVCYILITPDGERHMVADVGVAGNFEYSLNGEKSKIFHTSGYEVGSNPHGAEKVIDYMKSKGARISFDLSSPRMIKNERETIERIARKSDILFMTEEEAIEFKNQEPMKTLEEMSEKCEFIILKKGKLGSVVRRCQEQHSISVVKIQLANTCGAGDAYASGFLAGMTRGYSLEDCGMNGGYIASRVCAIEASHL